MDRVPEALMAFAAILTAVAALIVSVWQQVRIDRAERWTRENHREVQTLKSNGTNNKTPPA